MEDEEFDLSEASLFTFDLIELTNYEPPKSDAPKPLSDKTAQPQANKPPKPQQPSAQPPPQNPQADPNINAEEEPDRFPQQGDAENQNSADLGVSGESDAINAFEVAKSVAEMKTSLHRIIHSLLKYERYAELVNDAKLKTEITLFLQELPSLIASVTPENYDKVFKHIKERFDDITKDES